MSMCQNSRMTDPENRSRANAPVSRQPNVRPAQGATSTAQSDTRTAQADTSTAQGDSWTAQGDGLTSQGDTFARKATKLIPGPCNTRSMSHCQRRGALQPARRITMRRTLVLALAALPLAACAQQTAQMASLPRHPLAASAEPHPCRARRSRRRASIFPTRASRWPTASPCWSIPTARRRSWA